MLNIAKVLIYNPEGHILVLRRSDSHPKHPLHLDFPGGEVEAGERAAVAVSREIEEECNLTVKSSQLTLVFERDLTEPKPIHHLVFTATLAASDPHITLSWEHDKWQWITTQELLKKPLPTGVDEYYLTVLQYLKSVTE